MTKHPQGATFVQAQPMRRKPHTMTKHPQGATFVPAEPMIENL